MAEGKKPDRKEETEKLIEFILSKKLWVDDIQYDKFVSQGAEQRVYFKNKKQVIKLNDAIYYSKWLDYFNNLLLNNYFFPETAYELLGFTKQDENLYAVVRQPFVQATHPTDLENVKKFMLSNGFENTRNHDYYHPQLGIILEDLHDENVLTK